MPRLAYPAGADLIRFLAGQNLVDAVPTGAAALLDYDLFASSAVADFEGVTQRKFLLAMATRYYSPPMNHARLVDLGADLFTGTSVVYQPLNTPSQTLALDTDYRLGPPNAPANGTPYQFLELFPRWWAANLWSLQRALQVTGQWGYSQQVPDDVWQAILQRGTILALPELATVYAGHLSAWQQAGVREEYGGNPFGKLQDRYQALYDRVVGRYRRKSIF